MHTPCIGSETKITNLGPQLVLSVVIIAGETNSYVKSLLIPKLVCVRKVLLLKVNHNLGVRFLDEHFSFLEGVSKRYQC